MAINKEKWTRRFEGVLEWVLYNSICGIDRIEKENLVYYWFILPLSKHVRLYICRKLPVRFSFPLLKNYSFIIIVHVAIENYGIENSSIQQTLATSAPVIISS
jgi:hypothetical protein